MADGDTYHYELDTDETEPNVAIVRAVADIEGTNPHGLPPLWSRIGDLVSDLFDEPPSPDTQASVSFTYASYRITLDHTGNATLVKLATTSA